MKNVKDIILLSIMVILAILVGIGCVYLITREIQAERTHVEITVTITDVDYQEPYTTIQYNPTTKSHMPISHPASYKTYFEYEGFVLQSSTEGVYSYCCNKVGKKIKIKATQVVYKDNEVKYLFDGIIN